MLLSRNTRNKKTSGGTPQSIKYKLDCSTRISDADPNTKNWLSITRLLSPTHQVLLGDLLEKHKKVVVKFGDPKDLIPCSHFIQKETNQALILCCDA